MSWFDDVKRWFWDDREKAENTYRANAPLDWADWEEFERNVERDDDVDFNDHD